MAAKQTRRKTSRRAGGKAPRKKATRSKSEQRRGGGGKKLATSDAESTAGSGGAPLDAPHGGDGPQAHAAPPAEQLNPLSAESMAAWMRHALELPADFEVARLPEAARAVLAERNALRDDRAAFRDFSEQLEKLRPDDGAASLEHVIAMGLLGLPLLARIAHSLEEAQERAFVMMNAEGRIDQVVRGPARIVDPLIGLVNKGGAGGGWPPSAELRMAQALEALVPLLAKAQGVEDTPAERQIPEGHVADVFLRFPQIERRQVFNFLASGAVPHDPPTITAAPGDTEEVVLEDVILRWPHIEEQALPVLREQFSAQRVDAEGNPVDE